MSNLEPVLSPANLIFAKAEIFIRKMLRWALHFEVDTRCSLMYLVAN
jgi:hypothetical protein